MAESTGEVAVLRWPAEAFERTRLAASGTPRLLIVDTDADVPQLLDDLEDWLRHPADHGDLVARTEALRRRAVARASAPSLDDDGLLRYGGRWVVIPDAQLPIVALLVRSFGHLVRTDDLSAAYTAAGGTPNRSSLRTALVRIRARVEQVGLTLHAVRRRGVVLDVDPRATPADAERRAG